MERHGLTYMRASYLPRSTTAPHIIARRSFRSSSQKIDGRSSRAVRVAFVARSGLPTFQCRASIRHAARLCFDGRGDGDRPHRVRSGTLEPDQVATVLAELAEQH